MRSTKTSEQSHKVMLFDRGGLHEARYHQQHKKLPVWSMWKPETLANNFLCRQFLKCTVLINSEKENSTKWYNLFYERTSEEEKIYQESQPCYWTRTHNEVQGGGGDVLTPPPFLLFNSWCISFKVQGTQHFSWSILQSQLVELRKPSTPKPTLPLSADNMTSINCQHLTVKLHSCSP